MALDKKQRQSVAVALSIQERKDQASGVGARRAANVHRQLAERTNPKTGRPYGNRGARRILSRAAQRHQERAR